MPEISTRLLPPPGLPDCINIPAQPPRLTLRLPFGIRLESIRQSLTSYQPADELLMSFIGQLQPALPPIMMILTIARILKAMSDCVEAVKEAVSSLSPGPIIECIENLAEVIPKLFEFIPPLNYIPTVVDLILTVIAIMDAFISAIDAAIAASIRGVDFSAAVERNPVIARYTHCVERESEATKEGLVFALTAFSPLFMVLGEFLDVIGIPPVKKYVKPMRDTVAVFTDLDVSSIGAPLQAQLRDVQNLLAEIASVLRPFGG